MIYKRLSTILFSAFAVFAGVNASCKSGEGGGASDPSDLSNRLQTFNPAVPANIASYASSDLIINSFNLQSGLSEYCVQNIDTQVKQLTQSHYYCAQEVDINSIHCNCNQPQKAADASGHVTFYLRMLNFFSGGQYGHMQGGVYPTLDKRYYLFKTFTSEIRGIIAARSQPPQLGGRDLWFVTSHLQYDSVPTRVAQVNELIAYTQGLLREFPNALVIFAGDLYSQKGDADYAALESYFTDSWVQFSGDYTGGSTLPASNPVLRTDYIFYRAPADLQVSVLSYTVDRNTYSDHGRLIVHFGFNGNTVPTTPAPTSTPIPATPAPTQAPVTPAPATPAPGTSAPATPAPTDAPTSTPAPVTDAPATPAPVTDAPATPAPVTEAPTQSPTPTPTPTSAPNPTSCSASYSLTQRSGGAFTQDGVQLDVYDISIVNKGTCQITSASIKGVNTVQAWNFDSTSGVVNVFGGVAPFTAYTSAGFIAAQGQAADQSTFTYACSDSCPGTKMPAAVTQCNVMVETTPRATAEGSWTQDGLDYQIWDLSATNYGSSDATNIKFFITLPDGYRITQQWNLENDAVGDTKALVEFSLFGNALSANGGSYSKTSGVVVAGATPLDKGQVSISLVTANC